MKSSIIFNFTKIDASGTFYKEFNVTLKTGSKFNVYSEGKLLLSLLAEESRFFGLLSSGEIVTYKFKYQFFPKQSLYYIKDGSLFCRVKDKSFFQELKKLNSRLISLNIF